ncbi:MAG: Hpt domain-containing protein, partial [Roseobacter sp.]|nr:Hpt domain-containing protein [Roseobacter sp.]
MPEPIDKSVLDELQEAVGADFVSELIETFLSEAPGMMSELKEGFQASDIEAVRRAAHSLKSNAN